MQAPERQSGQLTGRLTGIVAADRNFLIGFNPSGLGSAGACLPSLPWGRSEMQDDMAFFRQTTRRSPIVMGRKTMQGIGRLLPQRLHLVRSRRRQLALQDGALLRQSRDYSDKQLQAGPPAWLWRDWNELDRLLRLWRSAEKQEVGCAEGAAEPRAFAIGGAELLGQLLAEDRLQDMYITIVAADLGQTPANTASTASARMPVYLPEALCRQIRPQLAGAEWIRELLKGERNLYPAKIYYLSLESVRS